MTSYNEIIHDGHPIGGAPSLKNRLIKFRRWATKDAKIQVHGAICIVNGEATDGTRGAPVLLYEAAPMPFILDDSGGVSGTNNNAKISAAELSGIGIGAIGVGGGNGGNHNSGNGNSATDTEARCGDVDNHADRAIYDRSVGCQVRTVRDMKGDEIALSVPLSAMITPNLIASSDAGRAVFACCNRRNQNGQLNVTDDECYTDDFWNVFGPTGRLEQIQAEKIHGNSGTTLLVKILQERKKVEAALAQHVLGMNDISVRFQPHLASTGTISYRAPYLAFLIHQRFANEQNPLVVGTALVDHNATKGRKALLDGTPSTFAPYARTLPSSVCLPTCWKRNELAILAGCIPGMPALQSVAARTVQLAYELMALVEAGLLRHYPMIFPPGMITWDRWVWAAAVYESRVIHVPTWMKGNIDDKINNDVRVWESAGVLVPFVDMLNHVDDLPVARWREQSQDVVVAEDDDVGEQPQRLTFHADEKTKKHNQIYRNYGAHDNDTFMLQYGFTRIGNPSDRVKIAWALVDGVGGVEPPINYEPVSSEKGGDDQHIPSSNRVFDSTNPIIIKAWWSEQRLALLGRVMNNADTLESLKKGKQIRFAAMNNGNIDSMLIAVAVVATIAPKLVDEMYGKSVDSSIPLLDGLKLDNTAQNVVRLYLSYLFAKKLGKLLQSLNSCLRDHFDLNQLWTKASSGGVTYVGRLEENDGSNDVSGGESLSSAVGWNTFFDANVYTNSMEVEPGCGNYYAMAPKSCVLTLYDGHVKSLNKSLDVMATDATFYENTKRQLEYLGCVIDRTTNITAGMTEVQPIVTPTSATPSEKEMDDQIKQLDECKASQDPSSSTRNYEHGNGQVNTSNKRDRDKDKSSKIDQRPPAIKLHIGNLSYKTQPNRLYDFFTGLYGKGSVLECHIPTERVTGASRGFGFVTMPDHHARTALESGRKHEMEGRILKVAESNSVGSSAKVMKQSRIAPPASSSDRCHDCGYSPRWCTCNPHIPMHMKNNMGINGPPLDIYGSGPYIGGPPPMLGGPPGLYGHHPRDIMDNHGHGFGRGSSGNRRSYSRSPSYRRERDRGYRRSRSRSRSYSRGRDRGDRNHREKRRYDDDDDRKRYDDDRRRGSSRRYRSKSRSSSRQRDNKALTPNRGRLIGEPAEIFDEPEGGGRSLSRSRSSPLDDNGIDRPSSSSKKKEGKDASGRSRSRSRDRSRRRRKRSSKGSRRDKESKRRVGS